MPYGEIGGGFFGLFLGGFWIILIVVAALLVGAGLVRKFFRKDKTPEDN